MAKLTSAEQEALYRTKGESDARSGSPKNSPGMSAGEKVLLAAVVPVLGAIGFVPNQSDRNRIAYEDGYQRGQEIRKIMGR